MPSRAAAKRAKQQLRHGKSPSTAAGELVREEIQHVRRGKHGARSTKQAVAIGLSKARRAGIPLRPPRTAKPTSRRAAERDHEVGQRRQKPRAPSKARSRAASRALRREGHEAASPRALASQARTSASRRGPRARTASARKAAHTKRAAPRKTSARKATTRKHHA